MKISTKTGYETGLVKQDLVLSVREMREKTGRLRRRLKTKGIQPGDTVAVYLSKEADLVCAAWALLAHQANIVFIHPSERGPEICPMLVRSTMAGWITEGRYAPVAGAAGVICIDAADGGDSEAAADKYSREEEGEAPEKNPLCMVFYHFCGPDVREEVFTQAELESYFERLDGLVPATVYRRILLSSCIRFSRKVMELIWASSRGLTAVLADVDDEAEVRTYTLPTDGIVMDFGLFYFGSYQETADRNKYALLFDTAGFADRRGFKAVWTPERHFNAFGGLYPNPSIMSAALAATTKRVQIRSGSLVAPLHHPVRIAEDWALVDNLSNGRAAVSFASGWQCDDFIFFPENYADRHNYMMSQIDIVRRLWAGEPIAFKNGLGKETPVAIFPRPLNGPLPVWITVSGRIETFIDAGRIGANILTHLLWQDAGELVEKIAAYRKALKDHGFDPASGKVSIMVHTFLGSSDEAVKEKVRKPLTQYIRSSTQLIQAMTRSNAAQNAREVGGRYGDVNDEVSGRLLDEMAGIAFERFFDQAALLGTVEKGRQLIRRLRSYDVDEIACLIDFGLGREEIIEGLSYLEQLKDEYARYPVEVTHCSPDSLQRRAGDAAVARFLATQQVLLVDDGDSLKNIRKKEPAPATRETFTTALNEEF